MQSSIHTLLSNLVVCIIFGSLCHTIPTTNSFTFRPNIIPWSKLQRVNMSSNNNIEHPFCQLPGDPSLVLSTNVDLGNAKSDIMKGP